MSRDVNTPSAVDGPTPTPPAIANPPRTSRRAAQLAILAALAMTTAVPASASAAATAGLSANGTLTITDQPAHDALITIGQLPSPLSKVIISSDTGITPTPAGCSTLLTTLICDTSAVNKLKLELGDGNDQVLRPLALNLLGAQVLPVGDLAVDLSGGAGDDTLQGGDGSDVIDGGDGDDHLFGFGGDDTITGGLGLDSVEPGAGTNVIDVSTPEADSVALSIGSTNTATASANDTFDRNGAVLNLDIVGANANVSASGSGGTASDSSAAVSVSVGLPSVDDLLGGVTASIAGGLVPAGVTLPLQPVIRSLDGVAGSVAVNVAGLPAGVTLNGRGLHVTLGCSVDCSAAASGVVDLGKGQVVPLTPSDAKVSASGTASLNLGFGGFDYTSIQRKLDKGQCVVIATRVRVKTSKGDEVKSYAIPVCGSKVTFKAASRPTASGKRATRSFTTTATCSRDCTLTPRFLLVKRGSATIARVKGTKFSAVGSSKRAFTTTWKLTAGEVARVRRAAKGSTNIRYIVSASATSGGVATTGTATFRTRK
jgi:hypothetical protein